MIDIKHIIASIVEEKRKHNKEPAIAHTQEIQNAVIELMKSEINDLCKTGEIDKHKTLNGWAFTIKEKNNNED